MRDADIPPVQTAAGQRSQASTLGAIAADEASDSSMTWFYSPMSDNSLSAQPR